MTLSQTVWAGVQRQAPFHDQVEEFVASEGAVHVRCGISSAELLSCALLRLEVWTEQGKRLSDAELAQRANLICQQITYLLEPLKTVELDAHSHTALVRSGKPKSRDGSLSYYELLVTDDQHALMQRYSFDKFARRRNPVAFPLTVEQLEQLVDDLIGAVGLVRN